MNKCLQQQQQQQMAETEIKPDDIRKNSDYDSYGSSDVVMEVKNGKESKKDEKKMIDSHNLIKIEIYDTIQLISTVNEKNKRNLIKNNISFKAYFFRNGKN